MRVMSSTAMCICVVLDIDVGIKLPAVFVLIHGK